MNFARSENSINWELVLPSTGLGLAGCLCIAAYAVMKEGPLGGL